jgi:hypothetical protein
VGEWVAKKNERLAEIAYWFGLDARTLEPQDQIGLMANLPRLLAQQMISDGKYDPADWENIDALWMTAYGDPDLARAAKRRAAERYVYEQCESARNSARSN